MIDARNIFAWFLLWLVAIIFIVMAIQGSAGKVLAVIFVPSELEVNDT